MPPIAVHAEPFTFPNFLRLREWKDHSYPVGMLTDDMALAYWEELAPLWLAHVRAMRKATADQLATLVKAKSLTAGAQHE